MLGFLFYSWNGLSKQSTKSAKIKERIAQILYLENSVSLSYTVVTDCKTDSTNNVSW